MAVGKRERKGTHVGGEEDILYLPCVTPRTQVSNTFFILTVTWLRQLNAVETSQMYFDLDQKADMAEHYVPFAHVQRKHKTSGHGVSEFLQGNQNFSFTCSPLSNVFLSEYQAREITR